MPFDGLTLKKLMKHFEDLNDTTLKQIYQPRKNEYYFQFGDFFLRVSLKPEFSFVSLSQKFWDDLPYPSNFVMLMRSLIKSARVVSISQLDFDRVLLIDFRKLKESGQVRKFRLVIELMGKFSNMILVDLDSEKIVDAHKRISTRFRDIQPGKRFEFYLSNQKNPFELKVEDLNFKTSDVKKELLKVVQGFSPLLIDEVIYRTGKENKILEKIKEVALEVIEDSGLYLYSSEKLEDVVGTRLHSFKDERPEYFTNPFEALEKFSEMLNKRDQFKSKIGNLIEVVKSRKEKLERTLNALKEQMDRYQKYDEYKRIGDLIMTNLHTLKQNEERSKVSLYDWKKNETVDVKINPTRSLLENARDYFEKYKKYSEKFKGSKARFESLKQELDYLEHIQYYLTSAESLDDIEEIREELINVGLIKQKKDKNKSKKPSSDGKYKIYEYNGFKILVGKNNKQNDELTFKVANKNDLWFHAKDIPGSHVILKINDEEPTEEVMRYAAILAAKHSKGSQSSKVAVDYTQVKNVWKPKGAKPGFVLYKNYKTIFVNPQDLEKI